MDRVNSIKVLVVDDEGIVLKSCQRVLSEEGFDVILAESADSALDILERENPAVLLQDIKMPGKDGLYLMERLLEKGPGVPVIVMSGYPTLETIAEAKKKGAVRFLPKPFIPEELVATIREVLSL
jgi:DNA-binding NtrC family response regulator